MRPKLSVLRACRRILKPGGRMALSTIVAAPGLSGPEHRRAVRLGPRATNSTRPIDTLVEAARFDAVEVTDVTSSFLETARAWHTEFAQHESELRDIIGPTWDERQKERGEIIQAIEEGLLLRLLVSGTARI
jgi:cyclopropane fatty-acyl-phospholipid synthase-like methyltransferase